MAFLVYRALVCDFENCPNEFAARCRDEFELEFLAEKTGWKIKPEKGNDYVGYIPPTYLCPEHSK